MLLNDNNSVSCYHSELPNTGTLSSVNVVGVVEDVISKAIPDASPAIGFQFYEWNFDAD